MLGSSRSTSQTRWQMQPTVSSGRGLQEETSVSMHESRLSLERENFITTPPVISHVWALYGTVC